MRATVRASSIVSLVVLLILSVTPFALAQEGQDAGSPTYLPLVSIASDSAPQESVIGHVVPLAEQRAALAYWTRERVSAAVASPLPIREAPALPKEVVEPAVAEELVLVAAGRPAANAERIARAAYPDDWASEDLSGAELDAFAAGIEAEAAAMAAAPSSINGTQQLYTSYIANSYVAMQTAPPHRYIGKLQYKDASGRDYSCSATAIRGNNIVTAGHCVYNTTSRGFYNSFAFIPAYRNGSRPFGTFAVSTCYILSAYPTSNGLGQYDIAVCRAGTNSAGQTLNAAVGSSGYALNSGYVRSVVSLGYPAFNNLHNHNTSTQGYLSWPGEYLRLCASETFSVSTDVRGMGCNWGAGSSGGPWIEALSLAWPTSYGTNGYAPGLNTGFVTGVNSYVVFGVQNIYAPRFTTATFTPLCQPLGC